MKRVKKKLIRFCLTIFGSLFLAVFQPCVVNSSDAAIDPCDSQFLTMEDCYQQQILTKDQELLWNEIISSYDTGNRGLFTVESGISIDDLQSMINDIQVYRGMDRVRYCDSLSDSVVEVRKHDNYLSIVMDMSVIDQQIQISSFNESCIKELIKGLGFDKSTLQKDACKALHFWMVKNCEYDYTLTKAGMSDAFKGEAVCAGFARVYQAVLQTCGVDCIYITGSANGQYHAWDSVKIADKTFYDDVTFDICTGSNEYCLCPKALAGHCPEI